MEGAKKWSWRVAANALVHATASIVNEVAGLLYVYSEMLSMDEEYQAEELAWTSACLSEIESLPETEHDEFPWETE